MVYDGTIEIKSLDDYRKYCKSEYTEVRGDIFVNERLSITSIKFPPKCRNIHIDGCERLIMVEFPEECENIYMDDCTGLVAAQFPKKCKDIYMRGCTGLERVKFPEECEAIYMDMCEKIVSVEFPKKCKIIHMNSCTGLRVVNFPEECHYIYLDGCTNIIPLNLPKKYKNIYVDDETSECVFHSYENEKFIYRINGVEFPRELFYGIYNGTLSAKEVFMIKDIEQRRIAYERLDKRKMLELKHEIVDEVKDDGYGHPMRIINVYTEQYLVPFKYLNCFCPSTGKEYFIETSEKSCYKAKLRSFGLEEGTFTKEY